MILVVVSFRPTAEYEEHASQSGPGQFAAVFRVESGADQTSRPRRNEPRRSVPNRPPLSPAILGTSADRDSESRRDGETQ